MTELEKLKRTASVIRDMTEGRLEMHAAFGNHVYIRPNDDAYVGLDMIIRSNYEQKCYDISFQANVRRMGSPMSAKDLGALHREVQQAYALLTALEMTKLQPTQKDMEELYQHLQGQTVARTEPVQELENCDMEMKM